MKVGIYTIHRDNNFGAMLQAYATQYVINKMGFYAEIVNLYVDFPFKRNSYVGKCNSIKSFIKNIYSLVNPKIWKKSERFDEFHHIMALSKHYSDLNEIYENPPFYDVHLVGSDQVWNVENGFKQQNYYFLDFLDSGERKISYASSFGNPNIAVTLYPKLKELLMQFAHISVREDSGVELVKKATGLKATRVLDPTLLLSATDWSEISIQEPLIKGNYILYYGFDKNSRCQEMIDVLRLELEMPVVGISVSTTTPYKFDRFYQEAGPREFINLIKYAAYIITSSFHGLAFAINFRKDFVVIRHGNRMSRMESLLDKFHLSHRIVSDVLMIKEILKEEKHIDYNIREKYIVEEVDRSMEWLHKTLSSIILSK